MKFCVLQLFILVLVTYEINGKRYSGSSSRSSGSRWGGIFSGSKPSNPRPSAPTSFHSTGKTSSSNFLHAESGRPSRPAASPPVKNIQPSHASPSHSTGFNTGKTVQEHHQQNSASVSHSNPYVRQPAQNPYIPSGGYGSHSNIPSAPHGISVPSYSNNHAGSPPYPSHLPNHPHPQPSITSSQYPGLHSSPPMHQPYYPSAPHASYMPHGSYTPHGAMSSYHPPQYHQPSYHAPPPTAPFVPGRTVYVPVESKSKGPGLGSMIATGVAGGVAAGATNAIVDHAISSIFRPSSSHVHTYPSAPAVGTPTVTHTTNNYYYGQPSSNGDSNNYSNNNNNGPPNNNNGSPNNGGYTGSNNGGSSNYDANQPMNNPSNQGGNPQNQASSGVSNIATDDKGNPPLATNGIASKSPDAQQENLVNNNIFSDDNLMKLTEELFNAQDQNLNQYVELNLQTRVTPSNQSTVPDEAPDHLFKLKPELDSIPTIRTLRALYDNHQRDGSQPESYTAERRTEEDAFLDEINKTTVMTKALNWLAEQKYIETNDFEKKDTLRRIWFSTFDNTSSGFERIFLSERFGDSGIVGMQNWIYFAHLESQKNVDYLGHVDMVNLNGKGALLKLNYRTEGFTMQNATIFVGTAPELELALYTICFYARPNNWCPVSLGGAKFFILTHSFKYFSKDLIDLGFPAF